MGSMYVSTFLWRAVTQMCAELGLVRLSIVSTAGNGAVVLSTSAVVPCCNSSELFWCLSLVRCTIWSTVLHIDERF